MSPLLNLSAFVMQVAVFGLTYLPTRFFTHFKVCGKENLANLPQGPIIIMSNHASQLDPGLLNLALPWTWRLRPAFIVALTKEEYLHLPLGKFMFGGKFFWAGGAYPAYKKRPTLDESLPHHLAVLAKEKVVAIFPEGKLSLDGKFGYAHPGLALLAHRSGASVVPTYIGGDYLMTASDFFCRKRHITITFGKPIRFSDYAPFERIYSRLEYRPIGERMFEEVKKLA